MRMPHSSQPAPLALFVFNRADLLRNTVESLLKNPLCEATDLYVFSDGARAGKKGEAEKVEAVRDFAHRLSGFKRIHVVERPTNAGCRTNVREGIDHVLKRHDRVIAIEDDLLVAPNFLDYMNGCLEKYRDEKRIWCVNGCSLSRDYLRIPDSWRFDSYFLPRNNSYGWATWRDRWAQVEFDLAKQYRSLKQHGNLEKLRRAGEDLPTMLRDAALGRISSWSVSLSTSLALSGGLCLTPVRSYVASQPSTGGTHVPARDDRAVNELSLAQWPLSFPDKMEVDATIGSLFAAVYRRPRQSWRARILDFASLAYWRARAAGSYCRRVVATLIQLVREKMRILLGNDLSIKPDVVIPSQALGSEYGGWTIAVGELNPQSVVLSFGVGEDASFDLALIEQFNLVVHAFDPTPQSIDWVSRQRFPSSFVMHEYGIDAVDGMRLFNPPANPLHVSHTLLPRQSTAAQAIRVPMKRLTTIMSELKLVSIDLLKLDVEGAEYEVLDDMLASSIRPRQLLVEFHHRFEKVGAAKTRESISKLRQAGYQLFAVSPRREEFSFILRA